MVLTTRMHRNVGFLGLALLIAFYIYEFFCGELIQHNNGLGWDGASYAEWAQRSSRSILLGHSVSEYYVGRLLPSIIIHQVCKWLGVAIDTPMSVIHAFYIYNCLLLLLCGWMWHQICRHYRWDLPMRFVSFAALFFNYALLKNFSYNPTLVDISGYTCGLAAFYFFITQRVRCLYALMIISAFIWPTMIFTVPLLLMFNPAPLEKSQHNNWNKIVCAMITLLLGLVVLLGVMGRGAQLQAGVTPIDRPLLPLSIPLLLLYFFFLLRPLVDIEALWKAKSALVWPRVIIAALLFIALKATTHYFSDHTPGPLKMSSYIELIAQASVINPLLNVVAHAMHYGPVFLLMAFLWKEVAALIRSHGAGLTLFAIMFGCLSIGPESRQFLNAWPFFALLTCEVANRRGVDWFFAYGIAVLGLVLSRFWLTINVGPWTGNFQAFPDQMLYMYTGPWMSYQMYGVFLAVTIISAIAVAGLLRASRRVPCPS